MELGSTYQSSSPNQSLIVCCHSNAQLLHRFTTRVNDSWKALICWGWIWRHFCCLCAVYKEGSDWSVVKREGYGRPSSLLHSSSRVCLFLFMNSHTQLEASWLSLSLHGHKEFRSHPVHLKLHKSARNACHRYLSGGTAQALAPPTRDGGELAVLRIVWWNHIVSHRYW